MTIVSNHSRLLAINRTQTFYLRHTYCVQTIKYGLSEPNNMMRSSARAARGRSSFPMSSLQICHVCERVLIQGVSNSSLSLFTSVDPQRHIHWQHVDLALFQTKNALKMTPNQTSFSSVVSCGLNIWDMLRCFVSALHEQLLGLSSFFFFFK